MNTWRRPSSSMLLGSKFSNMPPVYIGRQFLPHTRLPRIIEMIPTMLSFHSIQATGSDGVCQAHQALMFISAFIGEDVWMSPKWFFHVVSPGSLFTYLSL